MKTVLTALYEGIEAKNLLRTDVIRTIVSNEDIRAVLLLKSRERVEYYEKEFSHPRLVFIEASYPFPKGILDKFFGWTKFILLNTETTRLRRWIAFKDSASPVRYLTYTFGLFFSWLFAREPFRAIVRFLDLSFVRTDHFGKIFDEYRPDLVMLANLFDEPETALVREAKQRGIKTVGLVNSWDKVTARMMIRVLPDSFIVFNHSVHEELRAYNGVPKEKIFIGGMPHFDAYKKPPTVPRAMYLKAKGIPEGNTLVVFAPFGRAFNDTMWETIDLMHEMNERGDFGERVSVLVRFQPNDFLEETELKKRPWLIYDYPGKRFTFTRGVDWDMDEKDIEHLVNTLSAADAVICYASSFAVDAAYFDVPIVTVGFETREDTPYAKRATLHYTFEHYRKILALNATTHVETREELAAALRAALSDRKAKQAERKALAEDQLNFLDGTSGQRIGKHVRSLISSARY